MGLFLNRARNTALGNSFPVGGWSRESLKAARNASSTNALCIACVAVLDFVLDFRRRMPGSRAVNPTATFHRSQRSEFILEALLTSTLFLEAGLYLFFI